MELDPILSTRLETLTACLQKASNVEWWMTNLRDRQETKADGSRADSVDDESPETSGDFWLEEFFTEIRASVNDQFRAVEKVVKMPNSAWDEYPKLDRTTMDIFRECLACLGGRFMRNRRLENDLCRYADDLFNRWGMRYKTRAFPTAEDALRINFRRIIRLRLPGSIWAIPYLAHEYGHFIIEDQNRPKIQNRKNEEIQRALDNDSEIRALPESQRRSAAGDLVDEVIADVFGVFLLGPSYACSALMLKLDPRPKEAQLPAISVDIKRAWAILFMLEKDVLGLEPQVPESLRKLVSWLRGGWVRAQANSGAGDRGDEYLRDVVKNAADILKDTWPEGYDYNRPNGGWPRVHEWANALAGPDRKVPKVESGSLADAFNASWLARYLESITTTPANWGLEPAVKELNKLTKVSLELYDAVRAAQSEERQKRRARSSPRTQGAGSIG
jgi:hypothetical protein